MAVVKGIVAGLLALAGLGLVALGTMSASVLREPGPGPRSAPALSMRAFPPGADGPSAARTPVKPVDTPKTPVEPVQPEVRDAGAPAAKAPVDAGVPVPRAAAPPDAGAPRPAPPPAALGVMNLHASDTADVYVDGRRVGSSPVDGLKVKTGTRRVRFDCYDSAGNAVQGPVQSVTVTTDQAAAVDFTCPSGG
jgi:hypothetical protein